MARRGPGATPSWLQAQPATGVTAVANAPHHQEGLATFAGVGVAYRLGGLSSRRDWWVLSLLGSLGRKGDPEASLALPGSGHLAVASSQLLLAPARLLLVVTSWC